MIVSARRLVRLGLLSLGVAVCCSALLTAAGQTAQQKMSTAAPAASKVNDAEVAPSRLDLLRGAYGEDRANNDLISYHLDIRVDPEKKYISGKNTIRFKMLKDGKRIHLDLNEALKIDKILLDCHRAEVFARFGGGVCGFSGDAAGGADLRDRVLLFGESGGDGEIWEHYVQEGSRGARLDQHGVRRDGCEHVVAEQGSVA